MTSIATTATLGALARAARLARNWTQQQAADAAGVSRRFVSMFESGDHRNAELWRVLALLAALDVEVTAVHGRAGTSINRDASRDQSMSRPAPAFDLNRYLASLRSETTLSLRNSAAP